MPIHQIIFSCFMILLTIFQHIHDRHFVYARKPNSIVIRTDRLQFVKFPEFQLHRMDNPFARLSNTEYTTDDHTVQVEYLCYFPHKFYKIEMCCPFYGIVHIVLVSPQYDPLKLQRKLDHCISHLSMRSIVFHIHCTNDSALLIVFDEQRSRDLMLM